MKLLPFIISIPLILCSCNFTCSSKGGVVRTVKKFGPFKSQQWKKDKSSRYGMSGNWNKYQKKVGLSTMEVDNQLGTPDYQEISRGYEVWIYDLVDSEYPSCRSRLKIYFKKEKLAATDLEDLP